MLQQGELSSSMESLSYDSSVTSPASSTGHHNQRTKRMRTSFKHHQLRTMKTYFAINQNPDAKDLKQLAQKTGLSKRVLQVRKWDTSPSFDVSFVIILSGVVSKRKSKMEAKPNATRRLCERLRRTRSSGSRFWCNVGRFKRPFCSVTRRHASPLAFPKFPDPKL